MLILIYFDSYAIRSPYNHLISKVSFFKRDWAQFLKNKKEPRTSFQATFFVEFFGISLLQYYIDWPNFITKICLFAKIFSKMYLLHAQALDDVIRFKILEF